MNNRLKNKHSVLGDLGDFWYRQMSESDPAGASLARTIIHLQDAGNAVDKMSVTAQQLSGSNTNFVNNVTINFNPGDVRVLNLDIGQRTLSITRPVKYSIPGSAALQVAALPVDTPSPATEPTETSTVNTFGDNTYGSLWFPVPGSGRTVLFNSNEARPLYFVPIPIGVYPVSIVTKTAELISSYSFRAYAGHLLFFEDPTALFDNGTIFCRSALEAKSHIMDYTYQVDNVFSDGFYIARYMRATHSAVALQLALAEVAGLPIVREDATVRGIYTNFDTTVYDLGTQVLSIPNYIEHEPLVIGQLVNAGTIVAGEYVKVYSAANTAADPEWFRHPDLDAVWGASGLQLSTLSPFGTITVPDSVGTFSSNGGGAHLKMSGVYGTNVNAYWNFVRESETHTDRYLSDIPGVTAGSSANCVDFYFNHMLEFNSVVIKLRTVELGSERHQNVMSFIRRDLPLNVTPIILQ